MMMTSDLRQVVALEDQSPNRSGGKPATEVTVYPWLYVVSHTDPRYGGLSTAVPAAGASIAAQRKGDRSFAISLAAFCNPDERYQPHGYDGEQISFFPASRRAWILDRIQGNALHTELREKIVAAEGVHIHGLWEQSTAVASDMARTLGRPYVLSAHGMLEPWALAQGRLKKQLYAAVIERNTVAGAACLHALTVAEAEQYRNFGAKNPIAIIPNAVRVPDELDAEPFFARHQELRSKRIVLFMARLHPKKGADLLLRAWSQICKEHPDAHLVLAGPDSEGTEARLRSMVTDDGLEQQVSLIGMLDQPAKWSALAAAEAFVLPSHSEGLSMGVLEAMGAGLPVVITSGCNMPEVARHNAGWVVEPTVASIASTLREFLERSPEENAFTGQHGSRLIAARYTPDRVAAQMAEIYDYAARGIEPTTVELLHERRR